MIDLNAELKVIHDRHISTLISISRVCLIFSIVSAIVSIGILCAIIVAIGKPFVFLLGIPLVTTVHQARYYYREYRITRGELLLLILGDL